MSDWPGVATATCISTQHPRGGTTGGMVASSHASNSTAVWPAANRAIYMPFEVNAVCTAYQIGLEVAIQSGNLDVGIYDEVGNRLVSAGSTAVAAAGVQVVDITNTVLQPGAYFLAMNCDNTTASFRISAFGGVVATLQSIGIQQQAVGAVALPDPATFANPASLYVPFMFASTGSSTI